MKFSITVRGNRYPWTFYFHGDPEFLQAWRDDGLLIDEVISEIPQMHQTLGIPIWVSDLLYQIKRVLHDFLG